MNIKELIYFISVIETGNFTDAADICCVTQPTLSAGIKKLEEELDTPLIIRGTKNTGGIRPSIAGSKILTIAYSIRQEFEKIKKIAKDSKNPFIGDLRIGAFPTLCPYLMPTILPLFKNNLPQMRFFIIEEKTDMLITMLKQEKLDIAFLALPFGDFGDDFTDDFTGDNTPYLKKIPLFFDKFYLATPQQHALSQLPIIATENITAKELLLLEEGHCLRTQALAFCNITQKSQTDFRGTSLETLLSMVRMGTGYTLVPEIAMNHNHNFWHNDIAFVPLQDKTIGRMIYMVFNTNTLASDVINKCNAFLNADIIKKDISLTNN